MLFGVTAFPLYAYGRDDAVPPRPRLTCALAALALVSAGLELMAMAANMGDSLGSALDPQVLSAAVADTTFGRVWLGRIFLAIALLTLTLRARPGRDRAILTLSGLSLASIALTGHSALPGGGLGGLHRLADAVHLIAAGWWIGGLLALALSAQTLGSKATRVLKRFSRLGYVAVAAIVLSGLVKSLILIAPLDRLVTTAYGWTLLIKLAVFAGMGALALCNRVWITPRLAQGDRPTVWLRRLKTQVILEFALGIVLLAVVGALGAMSPPISE
jgi:putative copper resistance protein D